MEINDEKHFKPLLVPIAMSMVRLPWTSYRKRNKSFGSAHKIVCVVISVKHRQKLFRGTDGLNLDLSRHYDLS